MPLLHRALAHESSGIVRHYLVVDQTIEVISRCERGLVFLLPVLSDPAGKIGRGTDVEPMTLITQNVDIANHRAVSPEILNLRFATVQD